jgi:branched-chain amino acid transport system substrate-binding protein
VRRGFSYTAQYTVAGLVAALALGLAGCESSRVPDWAQQGIDTLTNAGVLQTAPRPVLRAPPPTAREPFDRKSPLAARSGSGMPAPSIQPQLARPNQPTPLPANQRASALNSPLAPGAAPPPAAGREFDLRPFIRNQGGSPGAAPLPQLGPASAPLPRRAPEGVRVAMMLPMSGPNAALGAAMRNAAQLALFDLADKKFELVFHDTGATPAEAADAAQLAVGDGVSLMLGPLLATSVRAVAPIARTAGINVIAFSNDRQVAGDGVFAMGFLPGDQVRRVTAFARSKGFSRFAVLAPDNAYGAAVIEALRGAVEAAGAALTRIALYDPAATDFNAIVRKLANYDTRRSVLLAQRRELKALGNDVAKQALKRLGNLQTIGDLPFDSLLVADGGRRLQALAALLPYYDIDPKKVRMLGTRQWDVPGLSTEPALIGGWYGAAPPSSRAAFEIQYTKAFGKKPPRLATLSYDATALAAVLARAGGQPSYSRASLTAASGFAGRDGLFRLRVTGLVERGLAVLEVRPQGVKVVSPAPEAFGRAMN